MGRGGGWQKKVQSVWLRYLWKWHRNSPTSNDAPGQTWSYAFGDVKLQVGEAEGVCWRICRQGTPSRDLQWRVWAGPTRRPALLPSPPYKRSSIAETAHAQFAVVVMLLRLVLVPMNLPHQALSQSSHFEPQQVVVVVLLCPRHPQNLPLNQSHWKMLTNFIHIIIASLIKHSYCSKFSCNILYCKFLLMSGCHTTR